MNVNPNETEVTINSAFSLAGTLAIPHGTTQPVPAILIISGTGENDRNGNGKGLNVNIYKDMADILGKMGYATLRYDKRGTHASGGDSYETGLWDLVDDSIACVQFLKSRLEVDPDRIFIFGHSEGASIAPIVHTKEPVHGLMLISGAVENLVHDTIPRQTGQALKELEHAKGIKGFLIRLLKVKDKAKKQNAAFIEKVLSSTKPTIRFKGKKIGAKWFREHAALNTFDYVSQVSCPLIAITGSNDLQTPPDHARKFAEAAKGESEWHIIPQMNHILRKYEKPHTMLGLMKEYKSLFTTPIDRDFVTLLEQWLHRHTTNQPT
ncbi:lysophospholipase [Paenibacillus sp. SC116]|uniref:alpha/beta hydrolase family protein n=1 Tax=Paenibacillus sp. SC116 TaxID=2968986 RepID=UPI00215A31CD|nr:lysophospholipase [Paenibacillus sp. SC116]MCR8845164.1 lysophospholipase [Paenibacillus sp. SC116]